MTPNAGTNYEDRKLLDTYLLFHYGTREEILAGSHLEATGTTLADACFCFPVATVRETFDLAAAPFGRALDLGCAVGRSAFELSMVAEEVIAIDFSRAFIEAAENLRSGQSLRYQRCGEGHLHDELVAHPPADARPERITFETGDAMDPRPGLGAFDLVHAANLLCRLPDPARFLDQLPALVEPGGQLVMATPATWLEEFTPARQQPPGSTLAFLQDHLGDAFDLPETRELPFLIREHMRKFQLSTSQCSLWTRKGSS